MLEKASGSRPRTTVIHHTLTPARHGEVAVFAALSVGQKRARLFFNGATAHKDITSPDLTDLTVTVLRGQAGVHVDGYFTGAPSQVSLRVAEQSLSLPLLPTQIACLAGQDCLLTTLNQAHARPREHASPLLDPDYIRRWLRHHAQHQGATAAVILNRLGKNNGGADFADRLSGKIQNTDLRTLVIIDIPGPTGQPNAPDARELILAPDAPGKRRMEAPKADPWTAPFGDEILLEYARHAWLAQAAGVAYLDLSDWLAPTTETTVFEAARAARPDAVISLTGRRAYAWKLPKKGNATPGDHICSPFDIKATFQRWVASPARLVEIPHIWRPHRLIGATAQPTTNRALWRFMSLCHPGAAPAQLVPKSSLREDPALLALAHDIFGHEPFRVPAPKTMKSTLAKDRGDKIVLVTAMKNEGPFLLEWIAYHRAIGVSDIIVFTNDCDDGTDTLLDLLAARGVVEHYPNPYQKMGLKPQHAAFRAAEKLSTVRSADWLMTLDVDEYINVHVGEGRLADLFAAIGDANMISCTWRLFGNGDIAGFTDDFLLRQFTRCAVKGAARPHQAWGFKTLYQNNGIFRKLGVHRPKGLHGAAVDQLKWVNGSVSPMPASEFRSAWRSNTATVGYDLVTLNHYAVRSTESFLVKRDRGRVNHVDRDQGAAYWFRMNHNTTEDTSIQRMVPALTAEWTNLMEDPAIAKAHTDCVARHREKIAALRAQPEPATFFDLLNSDRFRTLSRILPAFGANVFLAGPDSVPETLTTRFRDVPPPDGFYFTVDAPEDVQH